MHAFLTVRGEHDVLPNAGAPFADRGPSGTHVLTN